MTWEALTTIVVLAIIVEFSTEIIKSALPAIRGQSSRLVAIIIGILLCVSTHSGLLSIFKIYPLYPLIDYVLTGLIISRGSNIIHDMVSKLDMAGAKR